MARPRVLVTLDDGVAVRRGVESPTVLMKRAYSDAVELAGGLPLMVAPTSEPDALADLAELMQALVVTGGAFDLEASLSGASDGVRATKPRRTRFEWSLVQAALANGVPVLGVCGGMQLLNVVRGGTLLGDIAASIPGALEHEQPNPVSESAHEISIVPGTRLCALAGSTVARVNTTHHQACARIGEGLRVSATSDDGVVEAIEDTSGRLMGVQWHPEQLDDALSRALYGALVSSARR
ncbi:MAG: gamma-glutamyl-gamma-aminobutyrate hydrolase family protein [Deltaproteobacteria bacterium]|nr:gamma-glutamyl-gamma-aminobutyrate hydrolase family protein [Deltaproteobacteria bacterium]